MNDEKPLALQQHVAACADCVVGQSLCAEGQRLVKLCARQLADEIDAEIGRRIYEDIKAGRLP